MNRHRTVNCEFQALRLSKPRNLELSLALECLVALSHNARVLDLSSFNHLRLLGGFSVIEVRHTSQSLFDPLGRPAAAQTLIRGKGFHIVLREGMDESELSISLYHEVLEAATVAAENPPESVLEFNEGDFEEAARSAHTRYGIASPTTLNEMLESFGFKD